MANGKFVAYYRVSTVKQGASGLGLEAQQESVRSYLNGGRWKMVDEVTEVESGKRNDRPALANALALCRLHKATLIIAKLDRLARNVAFISNLMEAGVDFLAVDFPQANRLTAAHHCGRSRTRGSYDLGSHCVCSKGRQGARCEIGYTQARSDCQECS